MKKANYLRAVERVASSGLAVPETGARQLLENMKGDAFVGMMVQRVLESGASQDERAEALCRLLASYGLGSVVTGRLV
jgi:hypothetical protein